MTSLLKTGGEADERPRPARTRRTRTFTRTFTWIAAVAAALLLLTGAAATAGAALQAADGGYLSTGEHRFTTSTAALKTDEVDVGDAAAHPGDPDNDVGDLARVRVVVRPADPGTRLFVGIGPKAAVEDYLRGMAYDEFAGADLDPFHARFERHDGTADAARPGGRRFWAARSEGPGERVLTWDKAHGAWSLVVMREDGAPPLDVRASIGLRFGFLTPLGIGLLAAGALTLAAIPVVRRRGR